MPIAPVNGVSVSSGPVEDGTVRERKRGRRWNKTEDAVLIELVEQYGNRRWKRIAVEFAAKAGTDRSDVQCLHRWNKCLKPGLIKGPWREQEDNIISQMIESHGVNQMRWSAIAKYLPGRLGKQVRERWINHLDPTIVKTEWTPEEDAHLAKLQKEHGNRWKWIAELIPGRSENGVKNRWHSIKLAGKKPRVKSKKCRAPKPEQKLVEKSNFSGKRVRSTMDNTFLNMDSEDMAKVAQHARSLLQMSDNYAMSKMLMVGNANSTFAANVSHPGGKVVRSGGLPLQSKRLKLEEVPTIPAPIGNIRSNTEAFNNLNALQQLSAVGNKPLNWLNGTSLEAGVYNPFSGMTSLNPFTLVGNNVSGNFFHEVNSNAACDESVNLYKQLPNWPTYFSQFAASSNEESSTNTQDKALSSS